MFVAFTSEATLDLDFFLCEVINNFFFILTRNMPIYF